MMPGGILVHNRNLYIIARHTKRDKNIIILCKSYSTKGQVIMLHCSLRY